MTTYLHKQATANTHEPAIAKSAKTDLVKTNDAEGAGLPEQEAVAFDFMRFPIHRPAIQPKLTINEPGDIFEQEADAVAEKVMRMEVAETQGEQAKIVQRKCAACEKEDEELQRKEKGRHAAERKPGEDEKEEGERIIQRKELSGKNHKQYPPAENYVTHLSGGRPLNPGDKQFFESRIGYDFSKVRIHDNALAHESAKSMNALAYTHRNHIVFGANQYQPGSEKGRRLLAHELVHTVQQGSTVHNFVQRDLAVEPPGPAAVARELTPEEIQEAIRFNQQRFRSGEEIRNLRDVLGISPEPPVIDEEFVNTVVQWQAENNKTQDGKIGADTARFLGKEMLAESATDASQRGPAIQMLERGITLTLTNNTYTDTATTSQKNIRFNVSVPEGLNIRDYALVNFIRGQILRVPGPANPTVTMYGNNVPYNFAAEQVDSVDTDPIYWSTAGARWNYNVSGRTFTATDSPGRADGTFNSGDSADLNFRIALFRVRDLPLTTTGNVGAARSLVSRNWRFSVVRDAVTGVISHP
ncbi:hypothetical protein A8C56_04860 [Niabella ginsenosidivorans]|uniref:eCIS core domain-containing protein n=1 Tax=Niabella ginsenosidivorans TaxID=1176587 RepID=A0A1A9HYS3_9BACT|nr:DUF4157 domain-containing protein [Niabella ginsenosidivorans]ANH80403.1 hypothetical protein A8C56_04860 [Niabella ginsenosidivorans]